MPMVDLNRQKGNFAESLASAWLSRRCLVRPVATGTDIGIDLYCEAVVEEAPFQHFWVQVKAIGQANIDDHNVAHFDFETRHLRYWARQPVPVYAFLVPIVDWPPQEIEYIYGIRLSHKLVTEGIPEQETKRYSSSEGFGLDTLDEDLDKFVTELVPFDAATQLVPKGVVAPIEEVDEPIEDSFPMDVVLPHIEKLVYGIMFSAEIGLAEILESKTDDPRHHEIRHLLDGILRQFDDRPNPIGLTAVANSAYLNGELEVARNYLEAARNRVEGTEFDPDRKARTLEQIDVMMNRVEAELD